MAHHDDDKSKFSVKQICVRNDGLYEEQEEPMSPSGALLRHFNMDCYILVIIGLDKPVDVPSMKTTLQSTLIKHKRFSSVVKRYRKGHQQWLRKDVDIDNHVIVPELSVSYTQDFDFVEKYTASLATALPLDPSLPLWQIHVLNYKSAEAEASVILKIHHCIGDCTSLMSLFLDCTRKFCQPESMPTIPRINRYRRSNLPIWNVIGILQALWGVIFLVWCTVLDLVQFMATFLWMKDSKMLRGPPGVLHHPKALAHVTVDLEDIAIVRKAINGVVIYVFPFSAIALFLALSSEIIFVLITGDLIINISLLCRQLMMLLPGCLAPDLCGILTVYMPRIDRPSRKHQAFESEHLFQ